MSRRQLPKAIVRPEVDARALGCTCNICPLGIAGQKPITPFKGSGKLLVVSGRPSAVDDKHGEIRTTKTQKLLDNVLTTSGAREYVQTPAILCRPPDGTKDNDIKEAVQCCRPHIERAVEQVRGERGPGEPVWVLTTAQEAFNAVTGKLGSEDSWRGSPITCDLPDVKAIPTFDPWNIATAKGSRYAAVFTTHIDRYVKLATGQLPPFEWPEIIVDGPEVAGELRNILVISQSGGEVSVDIETRGLGLDSEISCVGLAADGHACCIQLPASPELDGLLRQILASGVMVGQNIAAFDRRVLARAGYALTDKWEDTLLASAILDPQLPKNLTFLASSEFHSEAWKSEFKTDKETGVMVGDWNSDDPTVQRERRVYCGRDAVVTLMLWKRQQERLRAYK